MLDRLLFSFSEWKNSKPDPFVWVCTCIWVLAPRHQGQQRLHYNVQNSISQCILCKWGNGSASKHAKSKIKVSIVACLHCHIFIEERLGRQRATSKMTLVWRLWLKPLTARGTPLKDSAVHFCSNTSTLSSGCQHVMMFSTPLKALMSHRQYVGSHRTSLLTISIMSGPLCCSFWPRITVTIL